MMKTRSCAAIGLLLCFAFVGLAFSPFLCRTLSSDDFSRIDDNSELNGQYFTQLLFNTKSDAFLRPLNHLSFGLTYHFWGMNPIPYGLFNLALHLGSALLIFSSVRLIFRSVTLALLVTFGWLLNLKPAFAVLMWGVGRTSGMATFFILLSLFFALRALRNHRVFWLPLSAFAGFLGMLAKESAVVGPIIVLLILLLMSRYDKKLKRKFIGCLALSFIPVLLGYLLLRIAAHAAWPATAPSYYAIKLDPLLLAHNLRSYLVRSMWASCLVIPLVLIFMRKPRASSRDIRGRLSPRCAAVIGFSLFFIALSPTLLVPSRSDLYVHFPGLFVVWAMIYPLSCSRSWPAGRNECGRLLALMAVLALLITPLAWAKGMKELKSRSVVYNSCWAIDHQLGSETPERVYLVYDENDPESTVLLRDENAKYFELCLRLFRKSSVSLILLPEQRVGKLKSGEWYFKFVPEKLLRRAETVTRISP